MRRINSSKIMPCIPRSSPPPPEPKVEATPLPPGYSFYTFPPEIRELIYRHLLTGRYKDSRDYLMRFKGYGVLQRQVGPLSTNVNILRTSRRIHEEATAVLYKTSIFSFELGMVILDCKVAKLDDSASMMQKIRLRVNMASFLGAPPSGSSSYKDPFLDFLNRLGPPTTPRKMCIVALETYRWRSTRFKKQRFEATATNRVALGLQPLTSFDTVIVIALFFLKPTGETPESPRFGHPKAFDFKPLIKRLESDLGPCEEKPHERHYCLKFRPRDHAARVLLELNELTQSLTTSPGP